MSDTETDTPKGKIPANRRELYLSLALTTALIANIPAFWVGYTMGAGML